MQSTHPHVLQGSVAQWRIVYCLLSAVMFTSNLHFVFFGSANVQPWNNSKGRSPDSDQEEFPEIGKVSPEFNHRQYLIKVKKDASRSKAKDVGHI